MRLKYCRKIYASYLRQAGIESEIVDLLSGRAPRKVFNANANGSLAPYNSMFIAGIHDEDPDTGVATFTLWEWESGVGNNSSGFFCMSCQQ